MRSIIATLCIACLTNTAFAETPGLTNLQVFPPDIKLQTNRGRQSFVVQATYADGITRDVTAEAKSALVNPALAKLEHQDLAAGLAIQLEAERADDRVLVAE